jgi:hypothetical protein
MTNPIRTTWFDGYQSGYTLTIKNARQLAKNICANEPEAGEAFIIFINELEALMKEAEKKAKGELLGHNVEHRITER